MFGYLLSTDFQASEMVALIGAPASPVSSYTLPWPCSWATIHFALSCSPSTKLVKILYAHGAVTVWSKLTTTMALAQASLITGLSAVGEEASTRIAAGLVATIDCSEEIWSGTVAPALVMIRLTLPLNGARPAATVASFSICTRQSLPTKLFDR